jgi:quinone-modifying oxidoreductase, subunit QmoA
MDSTERQSSESAEPGRSVHATILVVGGGIAGITAAVEAAEAGYEVVIVEKEAYLGGRVAQLNKYFPKLCPPACGLEINFQRIKKSPQIHFYTDAEVEKISGGPGNFEVTIRQHPRYVNDRCTGCNACAEVCPVERPDPFNLNMSNTKAAYLPHTTAFPMKYAIDDSVCTMSECAKCADACKYGAIDLEMKPETIQLNVGAVILATGWKPYDAKRIDNLGFGRYSDVVTNMMMERLAAPSGPTQGRIVRPSDGKPVQSVAFIQCAGSRDTTHLGYCSSICCLASLKQATYLREKNPDSKVYVFYIDLRTPGTYEVFSQKVQNDPNVSVIKGKVAKIVEDPSTHELTVEAEDILAERMLQVKVDLVVLATGMAASFDDGREAFPAAADSDHFFLEEDSAPGIIPAGCARGPFDVASSVRDATAAAMKAIQAVRGGAGAPAAK